MIDVELDWLAPELVEAERKAVDAPECLPDGPFPHFSTSLFFICLQLLRTIQYSNMML